MGDFCFLGLRKSFGPFAQPPLGTFDFQAFFNPKSLGPRLSSLEVALNLVRMFTCLCEVVLH